MCCFPISGGAAAAFKQEHSLSLMAFRFYLDCQIDCQLDAKRLFVTPINTHQTQVSLHGAQYPTLPNAKRQTKHQP